ncbi:MAG: 50S ribosomal protein L25/general stress protein Ctc [Bryobacterales bacterium]|nr:50S ribosomal protein L25/general stress protein Ctc [Bryobacteraceae bacterium]MDW8354878.1 50S ribosomal protein L25/general stress protein Ctc [Bryobacterales bacterium]
MRKDLTVRAQARSARGKNEARRLRAQGLIPGVVYGGGRPPVAVSVSPRDVIKILHSESGHNTIFQLAIDGDVTPVMIVDWQFHPVKDALLHVDFKRIDLAQRIRVSVPVHPVGDAKGVKQQGGLLEIVTRELEVECLPEEIPDSLPVDVTELMIGQSKRASDVPLPGSMVLLSPPDTVVVHVIALRHHEAARAPEGAAPAAPAEPEVIKKGKKEEAEET